MTRVAVVGAGAIGATAAHALADGGADVTLYDRGGIAAGATGRAAGVCYTAFESRREGRLAERSLSRFRELSAQRTGSEDDWSFVFTDCPYVWLAREGDVETADAVREGAERMRERGRTVEVVEAADLGAEFPGLRTDDVAAAALARDAGYADPAAYAESMADRAVAAGATIETDTEVAIESGSDGRRAPSVRTPDGTRPVEAVVVAAGAHSKGLLAGAGVRVAVKPYRVQALVTGGSNGSGVPMCYDATGGYYLRPHGDGLLVGDGTQAREFDPEDYEREADAGFVAASLDRIERAVGRRPVVDRAWAGLCMATPDRRPLVGPVGDDPDREVTAAAGLHVATGFHGHGFMRAPALGELVADAVLDGDVVEAYDPRRFDGDEEFEIVEGMAVS